MSKDAATIISEGLDAREHIATLERAIAANVAEIKRLRGALEQIGEGDCTSANGGCDQECAVTARAALRGEDSRD